jgi:hypothetical protein
MSTIPISLTEEEFREHVSPYLSKAKRGYECSIPLYKVFNYILYRLHTGCQWERLAIDADPQNLQKKRLAGRRFTTTFANGAGTGVCGAFGRRVLPPSCNC